MTKRTAFGTVVIGTLLLMGIAGDVRAQHVDQTPGAVVFLNRFGGVCFRGFDNPLNNTSPIVSRPSTSRLSATTTIGTACCVTRGPCSRRST